MSNLARGRAILQKPRRHRYLKLIALFKIGHGQRQLRSISLGLYTALRRVR